MPTNNTKQAAWVALGSFFSFAIGIISSMILSRFLDKAEYGTFKQVLYVYNTLLSIFLLGLPRAYSYFLPRLQLSLAKDFVRKITKLFFILGGVFSILLFWGSGFIADILKNPDLETAIKIFSVVPMLLMPTMGLEGVLATYRKTQLLAIYTITTRIFMLLCISLPVIIFDLGYIEAIVGFVVSSFATCILALFLMNYPFLKQKKIKCKISYSDIFRFSLPLLYASLFGMIIRSSDQFFISRFFGSSTFADFSNGFIELPIISMVVGACATVLSPIFSRMEHEKVDFKEEAFPIWISVFEKTAKLIYPVLAFCWVFSDSIMVLLYGQQYADSGIYFKLKNISNLFNLIIFAPLLINTGRVKIYSTVHAIVAILVIFLEFICVKIFNSPYSIATASVLCSLCKTFIFLYFVSKIFNVSIISLFPIKTIILILAPSLFILYIEHYTLSQMDINLLLALPIALVLYVLIFGAYSHYQRLNYLAIIKPLFRR